MRETAVRHAPLDGIRGLAALGVLSYHLVVHLGLLPVAPLGAMGVLMFFVLSGYLICGICWRSLGGVKSYLTFLRLRATRLAPVACALVLVGGAVLVFLGGLSAEEIAHDARYVLSQTTALALTRGIDIHYAFRPTWSLTVEWAFYLSFPAVLIVSKRLKLRGRTMCSAFTGIALVLYLAGLATPSNAFYHLPLANLGIMFAGAALAVHHKNRPDSELQARPAWSNFALLVLLTFVVLPGHTAGWGWKLSVLPATTIATLVLIHGSFSESFATRFLGWGFLRAVGLRAYSLYMWHMTIMWLVWAKFPTMPAHLQALTVVGLAAPVTIFSFHYLERPFMSSRRAQTSASSESSSSTRHPVVHSTEASRST